MKVWDSTKCIWSAKEEWLLSCKTECDAAFRTFHDPRPTRPQASSGKLFAMIQSSYTWGTTMRTQYGGKTASEDYFQGEDTAFSLKTLGPFLRAMKLQKVTRQEHRAGACVDLREDQQHLQREGRTMPELPPYVVSVTRGRAILTLRT